MIISFSKDFGTITLSVDKNNEEQDRINCQKLEKLHNSDNWITLLQLMAEVEGRYDEVVMKVKPQEQSFRETAIYAARKNGFCEAMMLLSKAVKAYNEFKAVKKGEISDQIDDLLGTNGEVINND